MSATGTQLGLDHTGLTYMLAMGGELMSIKGGLALPNICEKLSLPGLISFTIGEHGSKRLEALQ